MIFFKKDPISGFDLETIINNAVFPGLQGGPHNNTVGGISLWIAVCLKLAQSPEFKAYQTQVVSNCKALAAQLIELGYNLFSGGSDNHLVLVDLRPLGHQWSSTLLLVPGGIRIGTPAMTTRGFKEKDFIAAAGFIHEGVQIALEAKALATQFPLPGA
ncbi:hypothetical protein AAC387_Pa02g2760 [Persea americana]